MATQKQKLIWSRFILGLSLALSFSPLRVLADDDVIVGASAPDEYRPLGDEDLSHLRKNNDEVAQRLKNVRSGNEIQKILLDATLATRQGLSRAGIAQPRESNSRPVIDPSSLPRHTKLRAPHAPRSNDALIALDACQAITSPGHYVLTHDLSASGKSCISIQAKNVKLDCDGFKLSTEKTSAFAVQISSADHVTLDSCSIANVPNGQSLSIVQSTDVQVLKSHLQFVNVAQSLRTRFVKNYIAGAYQQDNSSYSQLIGNTLQGSPAVNINGMIQTSHGSHNLILHNTIDGGWDGNPATFGSVGADDGIDLFNESYDRVERNTISHNWDSGIETIGSVDHTVIADNTISDSVTAAIYSVHDTSWSDNIVRNNKAQHVTTMIRINDKWSGSTASTLYFTNNVFMGNQFSAPPPYNPLSPSPNYAWGGILDFQDIDYSNRQTAPAQPSVNVSYSVSNNIFKDNNFGPNAFSPFVLLPPGAGSNAFKDGGGNICAGAVGGSTVVTCIPPP